MRIVKILCFVLLSVSVTSSKEESPSDVVKKYISMLKNKDFEGTASLYHPEAKKRLFEVSKIDSLPKEEAEKIGINPEALKESDIEKKFAAVYPKILSIGFSKMGDLSLAEHTILSETIDKEFAFVKVLHNFVIQGKKVQTTEIMRLKKMENSWLILLSK